MRALLTRLLAVLPSLLARFLTTRVVAALGAIAVFVAGLLGLPDLGRLREILERVVEMIVMGGVALAVAVSLVFVLAWVVSHLRKPAKKETVPLLSWAALVVSYVPVGLTAVAAIGVFFPLLAPYMLKAFAFAVVAAALAWCISVAAVLVGGKKAELTRARRALLLAGTPWYCLAVWLSTYL